MTTSVVKELTKFNTASFSEALVNLLYKAEFDKVDGSVCFVTDTHHNEEQGIITVKLSDTSIFNLKIK